MLAYVEALREKTALPDLTTVMGSRTQPTTGRPKATVWEVAKLMQERRVTTVCVMDKALAGTATNAPRIAGVFSSKGVVLRAIAAGLDERCQSFDPTPRHRPSFDNHSRCIEKDAQ
jgi:CBS domain-containing protein